MSFTIRVPNSRIANRIPGVPYVKTLQADLTWNHGD